MPSSANYCLNLPSGRAALSPTKDQFVATNLIDGLDLYSIPGKHWLRTHEFHTTASGPPQSRLHSVTYLNKHTIVSGHTQSFVIVVKDTQRAGPGRFRQFFLPLNADIDRGWFVTHISYPIFPSDAAFSLTVTHTVVSLRLHFTAEAQLD